MDRVLGIRKVKGLTRIARRRAMLWAQSPGRNENAKGLELVGQSGVLLWKTLKQVGLGRDSFDVQNVMRCWPVDGDGTEHEPTKQELKCCSIYNAEALERNAERAAVHVILGDVAGTQLLGNAFKKDKPVFWHAPWNAYVVLNWHPSYILRQGGENAGWEYLTWRERFHAVKTAIEFPGRWGYVRSRGYKTVRTLAEFDAMEKHLRKQNRRASFDIEDGIVDGRRVLLMAGFGTGHYSDPKDRRSWTGESYSVVLDHPEARYSPGHMAEMKFRTKRLIEDPALKKSLQNGSYDSGCCRELLGARLRGYDYDTQYGTYLRYSFLRSCSLENLTYRFFPEFADYKDTVAEWSGNFALAPLDRLVLRNGGDCEITKRLEERFAPEVASGLVQVYIHAGFTLDEMEKRGPLLDWEAWKKASEIVPQLIGKLDRALGHVSGDPDFNCDSDLQVARLVYDVLKMPVGEAGRSTKKNILQLVMLETGNRTMDVIIKRRALGVIRNTFLKGYAASARLNGDELRTIWWLTGAVTGRLRSGKGDRAEAQGTVNFQNLHSNPLLQNLLVSDRNWRQAL